MCIEHEGDASTFAVCVIGVGLTFGADWWMIEIGAHAPLLARWTETKQETMWRALLPSGTFEIPGAEQTGPTSTVHLSDERKPGRHTFIYLLQKFSLLTLRDRDQFNIFNRCAYFCALDISVHTLAAVTVVFPTRAVWNGHTRVLTCLTNTNNYRERGGGEVLRKRDINIHHC